MRRQIKPQSVQNSLGSWLDERKSLARQADVLPLRQDMAALLTYVADNKVVGTQSAGNLPLAAIRQIAAAFVKPPLLDSTIGSKTFRLRTEEEVWSIHFLRILAEVGDLLKTGRARRWEVTLSGQRYLALPSMQQVAFLLAVWWYKVNWQVAFPVAGLGDRLPPHLASITLASLRALPVGSLVDFDRFADELVSATGLTWTARDSQFAPMLLRHSVRRLVIDILSDFGAVEREYRLAPLGKGTVSELSAFKITPWGSSLLDALILVGG